MEIHIKQSIQKALSNCKIEDGIEVFLSTPQLQFGDYSTNVAMILAKKLGKNPFELATQIAAAIQPDSVIAKAVAVKPGFVNVWVTQDVLSKPLLNATKEAFVFPEFHYGDAKKIMVEFAHPNTHKLFHIGHLRNISTGESVVRMLEAVGNTVIRSNYQGDVGMHIAKCLWGVKDIMKNKGKEVFDTLSLTEKIQLIGKAYSQGQTAYETDSRAKTEIIEINKQIYVQDPAIKELWQTTRAWSIAYFEEMYKRVGSHFDRCYFESEVHEAGLKTAKELLAKGILKESQGAVVFDGKPYGMDTRVFINSLGFPTYEGKELGLAPKEFGDFGTLDRCIHVVTPEQKSFFTITFKVEALMDPPKYEGKQYHLAYEWVKLKEGKMSSRTGNIIEGPWLIDEIKKKIQEKFTNDEETREILSVAAVKYSFLKNTTNSVIAFDIDESITLEGNSALYLLYTFVRTQSILDKAPKLEGAMPSSLSEDEATMARIMYQYTDKVYKAASTLSPHIIANYLYELAREYSVFYQKNPILKADKDQQFVRVMITKAVGNIIKHGLYLLGIKTVSKM